MKLIFIYGLPGSGKLTIGRELSALTGYRLFHNHLIVDLLLEVFEFGSPEFVELREKMWLQVFKCASDVNYEGLIFTFAPEKTVRQEFIERTLSQMHAAGDEVVFVELQCTHQEIENRLARDERRAYKKLVSLQQFRELMGAGIFAEPRMPVPQLRIDTTQQAPGVSASMIASYLRSV
jgi:adenylylsulfate kinase-like enzyme